jgi:hypothetical protein
MNYAKALTQTFLANIQTRFLVNFFHLARRDLFEGDERKHSFTHLHNLNFGP